MRRSLLLPAIALFLVFLGGLSWPALSRSAAAQDAHQARGAIVLDELEIAQRQLATRVWSIVICNCPRENWSKSLLNCPDGCADAQKQEILQRIKQGWDEQAILDEQRASYGPRAIGKPDDVLTYLLPVLFLLVCGGVVAFVFSRWKKAAALTRAARHAAGSTAADDEIAAIERELEEMR